MHRQMGIGFLMLTASIVFGVRLVDLSGGGAEWFSDPKVAATLATWCVYALLLHLRGNVDRHGRKMAVATLIGLSLILFTFVGVHLLAESRHSFVLPKAGSV
jgi:ABC-type transport system involved in cytochrome c biogenesis permease subunit